MENGDTVRDDVKEYYGKILQKSSDLKTNACTIQPKKVAKPIKDAMSMVHTEVSSRYYGCGLVIPDSLEGMSILDLGSGAGYDCYVLSKLVGQEGHVTGIDMTEEQISVANEYIDHHTKEFGFTKPNVDFVKGYIENLQEAGLKDATYDIIISNCVINLSPDKRSVLKEAYRVLKPGGEIYFSDVYCDKTLPPEIQKHKVLWGECVSGALYWKDLISISEEMGFCTPRLETSAAFNLANKELEKVVEGYKFVSATYRIFKPGPETTTEPGLVIYDGTVDECEETFKFDERFTFKKDEESCVDGETFSILENSRFKNDFTFKKGPVKCCSAPDVTPLNPFEIAESSPAGAPCCATKCC